MESSMMKSEKRLASLFVAEIAPEGPLVPKEGLLNSPAVAAEVAEVVVAAVAANAFL